MPLYTIYLLCALLMLTCQSQDKSDTSQSDRSQQEALTKPDAQQSSVIDINIPFFMKVTKNNPDAVVMDVRTPEEIAEGKIRGAMEIDYYSEDFKQQLDTLDRDNMYYIYCRSGNRSRKAAEMMQEMGFKKVFNLEGGYTAYESYISEQ